MEEMKARTNRVVNQEADDFEKSNELEEYQEDVYDERNGELSWTRR